MGKIHVLDRETVNQIAAGEVIERPASVVKELVENALDSGATGITVEAEQGGISMLRVSDNGSGFASEDIKTAFLRHATSKIETGADLFRIHSLGFRGEALSSIAAVSKVELLTYNTDDYLGTRYVIEGGEEKLFEEAGCPRGTTIIVRDLFYCVPARRKFLKTPVTETGYINELLCRLAIANPQISISLIANGRTLLHTSGNGKLKDAIYAAYGREIADNLIPVDYSDDTLTISGYICKPIAARSNRSLELCFVNGRDIRSTLLSKAIEDGYLGHLMQHKYPFTALSITIAPDAIDVNVHPTKYDIRFSDKEAVARAVSEAVRAAFRETILIPEATISKEDAEEKQEITRPAEVFETNRQSTERYQPVVPAISRPDTVRENDSDNYTSTPMADGLQQSPGFSPGNTEFSSCPSDTYSEPVFQKPAETISSEVFLQEKESVPSNAARMLQQEIITGEQTSFVDNSRAPEYRIVGQVFDTYWIIQLENEILLMDQHAAHEKINYERLLHQVETGEVYTQQMTPPAVVSLTIREEDAFNSSREYFSKLGFDVRHLGGREYGIFGVPTALFDISPQDYFAQTLDNLTESGGKEPLLRVLERLATMSCKAAIKGGQTITFREADHLVAELLTLENPYQCPHGRPTLISMSKYELEKKFKRIV